MKILVTGGAGFLGKNIAKYFSSHGHEVHGCGRGQLTESQKDEIGFSSWLSGSLNKHLLDQLHFLPDIVIHCAGGGSVDRSLVDPRSDYVDTVESTQIVLEYLRLQAPLAKFIYPSSPAVVGSFSNQPIAISTHPSPISAYGHDKLIAESICETYRHNYRMDIYIIRLFSVYGVGLKKQLLWDACNKFKKENPVQFWGDGNETRDFIHIEEVARLLYLVANNSNDKHLPYKMNCGSGQTHTVRDVIGLLKRHFENTPNVTFNNYIRPGHPRHYWSDNSQAYEYGWKPKSNLESGLIEYANWFKTSK